MSVDGCGCRESAGSGSPLDGAVPGERSPPLTELTPVLLVWWLWRFDW